MRGDTYYNLKRLHRWFAAAALALLAASVWMVVADQRREWEHYQRTFRDEIEPQMTGAPSGRPLAIEQLWLPDLSVNYNFRQVARFDRCTTCHVGIDRAAGGSPGESPLPRPYRSHPRLDLFVGPSSPHPMAEFGCTICHDGQGSATAFKFASHSPNDLAQRAEWRKAHGWFRNPDWDFSMRPKRFAESNCLKCHHEVTDLEPSRRFPDAPAAKLLAGYHLVRQNGCFGCHEIKGIGPAGEQLGPDMRLEPGTMPKVGPSLRDVKGKLDRAMLETWVAEPAGFRPDTRMPQFFGMHEHLDGKGLDDALRFEPVEVRAIAEYLLAASEKTSPLPAPPEVTEPPSANRGEQLFRLRGCLACHRHADHPGGKSTVGPDLSRTGAKFSTAAGKEWLASWLRDPARHSPRTLMPNPLLVPEPLPSGSAPETASDGKVGRSTAQSHRDPAEKVAGLRPTLHLTGHATKPQMTDPAADIAAYLAGSTGGWKLKPSAPLVGADLDALAVLYLSKTATRPKGDSPIFAAKRDIGTGEALLAAKIGTVPREPPDAAGLVATIDQKRKLLDVGRRTIARRGCFGCHDIPGFENAQPIGPALSDWGRKQESLLAFEQVDRFVNTASRFSEIQAPREGEAPGEGEAPAEPAGIVETAPPSAARQEPRPSVDREFYFEAIRTKRREGFIWQKLRAPRSFDYGTTANKAYDENLLMGRFSFTAAEREAIITFVLGLVAEPPKDKYLPRPDPRRRAIVEGRKVLDKYACAQCHTLEMERWTIDWDPAKAPEPPPAAADYPLLKPQVTLAQLAASQKPDRRGLCRAELVGMPQWNAAGEPEKAEDEDGNPQYAFVLWEPAVIAGKVWPVGGASVLVSPGQIVQRRPALGGDFARLLYPWAMAEAKDAGANPGTQEAWGWLPPPLVHTGRKLQPAWLYDYLLEPGVICPAALLRMPKYNLSPAEAAKFVDYFAAAAGADFPFDSDPRGRTARLATPRPEQHPQWEQALRLVADRKTFCAKCHLVGDYGPGGATRTVLAPNLERAGNRIRAEYLRRWIANPKSILPYTAMPVNFPIGQSLGQDLLSGSSPEQLGAVVDVLLNYDGYMKRRTSIEKWIESSGK